MKGRSCRYVFIIIQVVLYGTFLTLDILGMNITLSNRVKFTVVVLSFIYVIIRGKGNHRQIIFLRYALALTVISDVLILFSDYYFYGVITFIFAQQLYGMRITALFERERLFWDRKIPLKAAFLMLLCQGAVSTIVGILLWAMGMDINPLLVVSILYFVCISTNVARSLKLSKCFWHYRDIRYFTIGMILFLLCDINVGLFNMSDFMTPGPAYQTIYSISSILMWTFYGPSQVLIALSVDKQKNAQN